MAHLKKSILIQAPIVDRLIIECLHERSLDQTLENLKLLCEVSAE